MAIVSFTKLGLVKNQEINIVKWIDQEIEIKQYLPINDKLNLISRVINNSHDISKNYANPVQVNIYTD